MEFVSNNLRNFIENDSRLRKIENQILISKQISSGMNFLHSLNPYILHRDLRTPNILINNNLDCKIADFGISNNLIYKEIQNNELYTSLIPPECKRSFNKSEFTKKGDIYFFGWILFELFIGKKYDNEWDINYIINILNNENQINNSKINEFKSLIIKSLQNVIYF
jgi:serine/threonine protein kinase